MAAPGSAAAPFYVLDPSGSSIGGGHGVTGIADGRKTVTAAGTRVTLVGSSTVAKWVVVTALRTNTNVVTVGGSTVVAASGTRTGIPLTAGQSATLPIDNVQDVYIDSVVSGEGVAFAYFT